MAVSSVLQDYSRAKRPLSNHRRVKEIWARACLVTSPTIIALRDVVPSLTYIVAGLGMGLIALAFLMTGQGQIGRTSLRGLEPWLFAQAFALLACAVGFIISPVPTSAIAGIIISILLASTFVLVLRITNTTPKKSIGLLLLSLKILILTSTAFHFFGIEPANQSWENAARASMLNSWFGLYASRVQFPLTGGLISHASICGVVLVGTLLSTRTTTARLILLNIPPIICCLYGIFMTDGRVAFFASIFVIIYSLTIKLAGLRFGALVYLFGAPTFLLAIDLIPYWLLVEISRSGVAEEIVTGSNRSAMWLKSLQYLSENWIVAIFGIGSYSQASVQIFTFREFGLTNFMGPEGAISFHSAAMQTWFDSGIMGLAATVLFLSSVCRSIEKNIALPGFKEAGGILMFLILVGLFSIEGMAYRAPSHLALCVVAYIGLVGGQAAKRADRFGIS